MTKHEPRDSKALQIRWTLALRGAGVAEPRVEVDTQTLRATVEVGFGEREILSYALDGKGEVVSICDRVTVRLGSTADQGAVIGRLEAMEKRGD